VRAVGLLSDAQARAVLDTVLAAFRDPVLSSVPATGADDAPANAPGRLLALPSHWADGSADLPPVGRALLTLGLTLAVTPSAARGSRLGREVDDLVRSANTSRPATGNRPTAPDRTGTRVVDDGARSPAEALVEAPVEAPVGDRPTPPDRTASRPVDDPARRPADAPADEPVDVPADAPADTRPTVPVHVGIRSVDAPADTRRPATDDVGPEPTGHRWDGWGTAVESRFATLFYAVNLMTWLDLPRVDSPEPESGWATLEALGRSLLPTDPEQQDPIWRILAELDGHDPPTPTPVRLGAVTHRLNGLLERHRLAPDVFAQPGTLVVGRTHIDVVLGLHQIDLAARSCGLDQDPGWVPALGRIIAFHFDGGS
jgi:hypothetical protein